MVASKNKKFCATLTSNASNGRHICDAMHSTKCLPWLRHYACVRMFVICGCGCVCALCKHTENSLAWATKTFIKHLRCMIMNARCLLLYEHAVYDRKCIQLCNSEYWWELIVDASLRHIFYGFNAEQIILRTVIKATLISIVKHFVLIAPLELINAKLKSTKEALVYDEMSIKFLCWYSTQLGDGLKNKRNVINIANDFYPPLT